MGVTTDKINKPFNPRGNDQSPKGYNRAALYSGKALDFDGVNDTLITTYTSGFTGAQEFTYCTYVNADNIALNQHFLYAAEVTGWGLQSLQIRSNGTIRFFAGTGTESTSYVTSETIEANKWYFVVGVHTPTENKIYLNGVLNATAAAANLTAAPTAINIQSAFNGEAANAKVFNTALTAAQVADLYNNPEKVVPTGVDNTALKLWLPMMEGAGTTAYDGSGNGNHGTISGATYQHGIGAPVAQTAVIDWNKGENLLTESNNFTDSDWTKVYSGTGSTAPSLTANYAQGPSGYSDATRLQATITGTATGDYSLVQQQYSTTSGTYTSSIYVKSNTASSQTIYFRESSADNISTFTVTTEWTRIEKTDTSSSNWVTIGVRGSATGAASIDILIWGANGEEASTAGPYIPTLATAQTSPVLLPQGLTTGRDITGVNLFENVRKQGALNLDGNSWAEVHDNESLDITDAITLEAWVYWDGTSAKGIFGRWDLVNNKRSYLLYTSTPARFNFFVSSNGTLNTNQQNNTDISTGWNHIVGVYDGANIITYLNGSADGSKAYSSDIYASDVDIEIGRYDLNSANAYPNDIAQPRIYNRALTAEEVQRNYNAGKNTYTN